MHLIARNTILIFLAAFGYQALWAFASRNGTFSLMREYSSQNRLPGTEESYTTEFTRWPWMDEYLRSLLTIFWPMVNGTQPGSSLMCFYFAGQGIVAWILSMLEGMRRPNESSWKVVSFTTTYGLLFQGLGIGIIGPLFLIFSPLPDRRTANVLVRYSTDIEGIIPAVVGGVIVPTIIMSLHAPTVLSLQEKIDMIRLWQFFPLLSSLTLYLWIRPIRAFVWSTNSDSAKNDPQAQRSALRRVYLFGLCCAAIPHVGTLTVSLMAYLFPEFFAAGIASALQPISLFMPFSPFSGAVAETVGQGAHWFLQWDMILMFCTYVVWAYFANIKVKYPDSGILSLTAMIRLVGTSLLFGPVGAALLALWERDEIEIERQLKVTSRGKTM